MPTYSASLYFGDGWAQPKVISRVASNPELRDNGLLARLLVAMPPRRPKQWSELDAAYRHIVERLLSLDFGSDVLAAGNGDNSEESGGRGFVAAN